jgi:hypothetical protein
MNKSCHLSLGEMAGSTYAGVRLIFGLSLETGKELWNKLEYIERGSN